MPTWCSPIYNETNTFWELKLAESPAEVVEYARQKAEKDLARACQIIERLPRNAVREPLETLVNQAQSELGQGLSLEAKASTGGTAALPVWAKAARCFTRVQVRAMQVVEAIEPPPSKPEDFGV